jgi:predicted  nucleic acid-binding Zn-ribbon protein
MVLLLSFAQNVLISFNQDRLNELRLEAYAEVERLEIEVERLRKDKVNLQRTLGKVRKSRDHYKRQLDHALKELAKPPRKRA